MRRPRDSMQGWEVDAVNYARSREYQQERAERAEAQVRRLREGLAEARDALAAAMRVMVNCGAVEDYITAATDAGVTEGFGERIEQALAETIPAS